MARGKQTCKILKEIRKQIAAENDIKLVIEECTYQGDCKGTCPKCEAEVRYLERELEKRQRMGKAAVIAGMAVGTMLTATSCDRLNPRPLEGDVPYIPDSTEMPNPDDTIPEEAYQLEGEVMAPVPDSLEKGKKACGTFDEPLEIVGKIEEEEDYVTPGLIAIEEIEDLDEFVKEGPDEFGVYQTVDEMPKFPGGDEGLYQFIKVNMKYPLEAKEKGYRGRVYVNFIVEPDGSLSNIKVLRGIGGGCDEEAVRIVESLPKFKPGMQNGEAVRVSYMIPINFKLEDN